MSDTYADPDRTDRLEMPEPSEPPRRRVKVAHLVTGLVFLGLAGTWALRANGTVGDLEIAVLVPVVLVVAGAIGLLALVVANVRAASARRRRWAGPAAPGGGPRPATTGEITDPHDPTDSHDSNSNDNKEQ